MADGGRDVRIPIYVLPDPDDPARQVHVERVLLHEMRLQCQLEQVAWRRLWAELRRSQVRDAEVWTDVYSLLSAASCLYEFLNLSSHGERLRDCTETEPDSVLLEHEVRNSIVHFAETMTGGAVAVTPKYEGTVKSDCWVQAVELLPMRP